MGIVAFFLILILPGVIWTLAIWPLRDSSEDELSLGERIIFGYLISLATTPILTIGFNILFGVKINAISTILSIGIVSVAGFSVLLYRTRFQLLKK